MKNLTLFLLAACYIGTPSLVAQDVDARFSRLDRNGDGVIDKDEIPEQLRQRLMNLDKNGDGKISREEMMAGRNVRPDAGAESNPNVRPNVDRFQQLLQRGDKNGDGKLDLNELPEPMRQRMARLDTNGDGAIDANEFSATLNKGQQSRGQQSQKNKDAENRSENPKRRGEGTGGPDRKANQPDAMARFQKLMKEIPKDDNGNVDLAAIKDEARSKRLSRFDTNSDQLLDAKELRAMAQQFREAGANSNQPRGSRQPGAEAKNKNDRKLDRGSERSPQRPKRPAGSDKE